MTVDWTDFMVTEANKIWFEHDGVREKIESESETITPAAAFVAPILADASNMAPESEAAQVVALTESTYQSVEVGISIKIS